METTRHQILGILRRRQATVEDLTKELELAPATIRRHLDILARDGHVDVAQVRRKTGRPHYVFSLSEKGRDLFPQQYVRITNRLLEEIQSLTADDTAGRSGSDIAQLVFERMTQRLAKRILPRLHGSSPRERVESAVAALSEEGIAFEVEANEAGEMLLVGHGCPCPALANGGERACAHDQRLLSLLLGADVSYVEPAAAGLDGSCAYRVGKARTEATLPVANRLV
jgi:predicted ArsR family transcriptional regulator